MSAFLLVLGCLAFSGDGHRVKTANQLQELQDSSALAELNQSKSSSGKWDKLKPVMQALMLLALNPADAFVAPSVGLRNRFGVAASSRPGPSMMSWDRAGSLPHAGLAQRGSPLKMTLDENPLDDDAMDDDGDGSILYKKDPPSMRVDNFDNFGPGPPPAPPDAVCSLDNLGACSQTELELLYVDVLWNYYDEKKQFVDDAQYDELVSELNWQGSGFPSLRRQEIAFVKAAVAFAKGEPVVSDEQWQVMKADVKGATGKRKDVTQFLLYARSLRETAAIREKLEKEMCDAGIEMAVTPSGLSCTLSDVSTGLQNNVKDVLEMYVALSLVPTTICTAAWAVVAAIAGGPNALFDTAIFGIPAAGAASYGITKQLIRYVELTQPQLLQGQCPCCESEISIMATSGTDPNPQITCGTCSTSLGIDVFNRQVGQAQGLNVIGDPTQGKKWIDDILTQAAVLTSDVVLGKPNEETMLGAMAKGEKKEKVALDTSKLTYSLDHLKDGIFAWAILLGYGLFGEQFVARVRGKGIALHSQAINAFCQRYSIPKKLNQKYIQTAKRNGHDLGFLVDGQKLFGDGVFGKEALAWWKEQGF